MRPRPVVVIRGEQGGEVPQVGKCSENSVHERQVLSRNSATSKILGKFSISAPPIFLKNHHCSRYRY